MDKHLIQVLMNQSELIGTMKSEAHRAMQTDNVVDALEQKIALQGIKEARQLTLKKLGVLHEKSTISTSDSSTDSKHREHSKENDITS